MALFGRETQEEKAQAESYARWLQSQNVMAIASLVLGIFSFIEFGVLWIFGIGGIVTGIIALRQLKSFPSTPAMEVAQPENSKANVGSLSYADSDVPPPIDASVYENERPAVARTKGKALAWAGIVASCLSLVIASLLYARVFG